MRVAPPNADGTADLEHYGHHFRIVLAAWSFEKRPDGTDDVSLLQTPVLHCTDPGCTYIAQSFLPLLGDPQSQLVHAYYLQAKGGAASLDEAKATIAQRGRAARNAAAEDRLFPADVPKVMKPPSAL